MRSSSTSKLDEITAALSPHGLILRGGFNFAAADDAPPGPSGAAARTVVLVGNAGAAYWSHFQHWREQQPAALANPLDTWSRNVIGAVAEQLGARAVSPSDVPYLPFQQWAMRAESLKPSPLGILMHPIYGLWHAYRGALLFAAEIPIQAPDKAIHLCDACSGKPCLKTCPVDAYSETTFDYSGCVEHVRSPGGSRCRSVGCLDRNACPQGETFRYPPAVQAFHMASYIRQKG
ncbi:hypothetical protein [Arvimicrobium flavum]|uniref:hypothetical protein n=1 Tax=Arvimicrobium flavum TaxID=3393320 RepID=UPI00237AC2FB|nr:hypothetical protein [Mesorhizobium shangrilense]